MSRLRGQDRTDPMLRLVWSDVPEDYRDKPVTPTTWAPMAASLQKGSITPVIKALVRRARSKVSIPSGARAHPVWYAPSCGVHRKREDDLIECFLLLVEEHNPAGRQGLGAPAEPGKHSNAAKSIAEICGEYFKLSSDKDIFALRAHDAPFFPHLRERTLFVRQAANLSHVKAALQHHLTLVSGQADDRVQVIDTLPLPVHLHAQRP